MKRKEKRASAIGLALAGGGPEGAVWEIGALRALDEAIEGMELHQLDLYVGVSAGAFIASSLANGIDSAQLCRTIVQKNAGEHPFDPELFFMPAFDEFFRSGLKLPELALEAVAEYLKSPKDNTIGRSLTRLGRALPLGLFNNRPIRRYLEQLLSKPGHSDDFRELKRKLFVVAADLDSGKAVAFGKKGWDHVPISHAVQASTALPGLYPPVLIDGRHYLDGVLLKTLHTSTILDEGCDLAFCINPIVPVDTESSVSKGFMRTGKLVNRGMPAVLSQTFRTLIHSRLTLGISSYEDRYREANVLLFEPDRDDYRMFFTNIFSFAARKAVCEHAYRSTLANIAGRRQDLEPKLAHHGLRLRPEVLNDPERDIWLHAGLEERAAEKSVTQRLDQALERLEQLIHPQDEEARLTTTRPS